MSEETITTLRTLSEIPPLTAPNMLTNYDKFWAGGREFNREAPGSLVWKTADGWRFWLGEEVKPGVWTMGCDAGAGELFAFGIYDEPAEVVAAFERMVG
jgi:hypothetical protein